ncbi:hypothetical protein OsI_00371 [Oryza sativa Indica Group]|uniref:Uncharacterized protein n=1 Tax=Oryza sativa subsp. indica TaxID=39946 RepID=A2WKL3_ORYSI|nr:hypothetical protein OsI_00371 [Oryza sativa Indica Group]
MPTRSWPRKKLAREAAMSVSVLCNAAEGLTDGSRAVRTVTYLIGADGVAADPGDGSEWQDGGPEHGPPQRAAAAAAAAVTGRFGQPERRPDLRHSGEEDHHEREVVGNHVALEEKAMRWLVNKRTCSHGEGEGAHSQELLHELPRRRRRRAGGAVLFAGGSGGFGGADLKTVATYLQHLQIVSTGLHHHCQLTYWLWSNQSPPQILQGEVNKRQPVYYIEVLPLVQGQL